MCLRAVPLPPTFPRRIEVAFNPRGSQVVIQAQLPDRSCIPEVRAFNYIKTKDEIKPALRPKREVAELYRGTVSQTALLCVRAVVRALPWLESVNFNGHVEAVNPATGEEEYPCLISVEVPTRALPSDRSCVACELKSACDTSGLLYRRIRMSRSPSSQYLTST